MTPKSTARSDTEGKPQVQPEVPLSARAQEGPGDAGRATTLLGAKRLLGSGLTHPAGGAVIALIVFCVAFGLASPNFFTVDNFTYDARNMSFTALAALGETIVILTGQIDLSVGTAMGLGGIVAPLLIQHGYGTPVAIVGSLAAGTCLGAINGIVTAYFNVSSFVVTLGTLYVGRGAIYMLTGDHALQSFTPPLTTAGQGSIAGVPIPFVVLVIAALVLSWLLSNTRFGRRIYAVGGNPQAALRMGIPIIRTRAIAFVISGFLSAAAGLLMTGWLGVGVPNSGLGYELNVIAAAVLGGASLFGGIGVVWGAAVGAALITVLINGLPLVNVSNYMQEITLGTVIVLAVLVDRWRARANR